MRRSLQAAALTVALAAAAGAEDRPPPPLGVRTLTPAGGRAVEAVVEGRVLATAVVDAGPVRGVLLLVDDEAEAPPRLVLFDPVAAVLAELGAAPPEATELAVLASEATEGTEAAVEVLAGEPGVAWTLGLLRPGPALDQPRRLLALPHLSLAGLAAVGGLGEREWLVPDVGLLRRYERRSGELMAAGEVETPVRVERRGSALLVARPPTAVLRPPDGPLAVAGPEANGDRRLRTVLLDPSRSEDGRSVETWSRLPGPEKVETSEPLLVDARPFLLVTTFPSDKLGVFEKARLRVLPLVPDRTRAGRPPSFAVDTEAHRWHRPEIVVRDLDGDGRDDLTLLHPKGLGGDDLLVDVHFGLGGGGFRRLPVRVELNGAGAGAHHFGPDFDGDGRPDLLTVRGGTVRLYAGSTDPRKTPVAKKPRELVWPTAEAGSTDSPRIDLGETVPVDLDGDGRSELLAGPTMESGRSVLRWIELAPAGGR